MTSKELKEKVRIILGSWYAVDISDELGNESFKWHDVRLFGSKVQIENNKPEITFSIAREQILNVRVSNMCVEMGISIFVRNWANFIDDVNTQLEKDGKFEVVD